MNTVAGKTTSGKVWHVAIFARVGLGGKWVPLCSDHRVRNHLRIRDLATVSAYRLCQHCERASEQIAAAVAVVQS